MINWFDVPSESPNKDLTLKNLKVSENGTYGESGVAYSSVEVDVNDGGGGDSDFSTAEVTIINNSSALIKIDNLVGIDQEDDVITTSYPLILPNATGTLLAILYKGSARFEPPFSISEISGSATEEAGGFLTITGDCSITAISDI